MGEIWEMIVLFVYCFEERCYIYGDEIWGRLSLFCSMGNLGVVMIGYGVFVGGMNILWYIIFINFLILCVYYFNISDYVKMKKFIILFFISDFLCFMFFEVFKVV